MNQEKNTKYYGDAILIFFTLILLVTLQTVPVFAEQNKAEMTETKELILKQNEVLPNLEKESELTALLN